jgi:hypothetical protein
MTHESPGSAQFARVVETRYGVAGACLVPAPRGWTGETYVVLAPERRPLFAKWYRDDLLPPATLPGLPVLAALHRAGVRGLTVPVPAVDGALHVPVRGGVLVLFEHIEGVQSTDFDAAALGEVMAQVHGTSSPGGVDVPRESFHPHYAADLWPTLDRAAAADGDEVVRGLRAFLHPMGDELHRGWTAFEAVAERCRETAFPLVLTHGDALWNVMVDEAGVLHLVDWDELILAPAERDLWFFTERPEFMRAYRAHRARLAVPLDALAVSYYVHHRYFEELRAFTLTILGDGDTTRRAEALALLRGAWITGLRRRVAAGGL